MQKLIQRVFLAAALSALFACGEHTVPEGDLETGGDWTNSGGDTWAPQDEQDDTAGDEDASEDDDTAGDEDTADDEDTTGEDDGVDHGDDETEEEPVDPLEQAREDLVGFYAMRARVARIQELPIFGDTPAVTVSLGVSEIHWDGDDLMVSETGCHVEVESDSVDTIIPDAVPQSTPARTALVDVYDNGNGTFGWSREVMSTAVGATLVNPDSDALPTSASDSRVFDQDGDGNPGITVLINAIFSGEIYAVQRQRDEYVQGVIEGDDLSALVSDSSEQSVIGASTFALDTNVIQSNDPDANRSFVVMKRLDRELTCDELFPLLGTIFND